MRSAKRSWKYGSPMGAGPTTAPAARQLLVRDAGARGTTERKDGEAAEAGVAAPALEVGSRVVERVAELDQHVERHEEPEEVLAPRVVDEMLDDDERATFRQRVIRCTNELLL